MGDLIQLDRPSDTIAVLTLDHAEKRNALSIAMREEIADALDALADEDNVKAVVVTGAGPVFCAGFDLREFERAAGDEAFAAELWASADRFHVRLPTFPHVLIAALNGPAIAGGFDLAVLCDLRVAATTTTFSHPEYTFGDVVYGPLADIVGGGLARELCMTGRTIDAEAALAAGLANAVVEPDQVLPTALMMAERVAKGDAGALRRTKAKAVRRAGTLQSGGTLDL